MHLWLLANRGEFHRTITKNLICPVNMSRAPIKPKIDWVPLREAVFQFGIAKNVENTDPPKKIIEANIEKAFEPVDLGQSYQLSLPKLRKVLHESSGAARAEIDVENLIFTFYFDDGTVMGGFPWEILNTTQEKLDPKVEAQFLFEKNMRRSSEEETTQHSKRAQAIRWAAGLVWHQFMLRAFDRAVSTAAAVLYGRLGSLSAKYEQIPAEIWPLLRIFDWNNGVAVAPDGTTYWSIHVEDSALVESADPLKQAPRTTIQAAIKTAYDEAEISGIKPPNISELPSAVHRLLKAKGYQASGNVIKQLGAAPEFARRRRSRGRTVRSERAPLPGK